MHVPLLLTLALPVGPILAAPAMASVERRFTDEELDGLARALAAYFDARAAGADLGAANARVAEDLAALAARLEGAHPLRETNDLGRALWLSQGYDRHRMSPGRVEEDVFARGAFEEAGMELAYRVPKDYDPRGEGHPLILAIPDQDEGPAEHLRARWTHRELLDRAILVVPSMPSDQATWDRVVVSGRPGGIGHALAALRFATETLALDFDRVYVVGTGKGVPVAVALGNYAPQRFAGIVGRAGDAGSLGPDNFANLPTCFTGGGLEATAFRDAARELGFDNCRLDPSGKEADVWAWIEGHERAALPTSVTIAVGDPYPTRAYWLRIAPTATDARANGLVDRAKNTIRITSHEVSHATLYLNEALVDLDRPVRVVCNGVEVTATIERHLASTLDMLHDGTSDPGAVYVARAVFATTGAEADATAGDRSSDPELERRLAGAGTDAGRLWSLYEWCRGTDRASGGSVALERLLRIDPDHERARRALGHRRAGDRWFTSEEALKRYRRSQDPALARAKGYVEYQSVWMHPDERSRVTKGLVKDPESGLWLSREDREHRAAGWVRQDLEWILPAESAKVDAGLWYVDGEWVDLGRANLRHARIDSMWHIPAGEVLVHATADRQVALRAVPPMRRALADLQRVFGAVPVLPLPVAVLRDEEQYDRFAAGDPEGRRRATHAGRLHVIHSAFFAESWFPLVDGEREFRGMGVCYWDPLIPHGDLFGVHSARLAVGLSYVEALDPSPKAVRRALRSGPSRDYYAEYQAEKRLPAWLRYGGAVYAERFFRDDTVAEGGDPWWARAWSIDNITQRGGLRPLAEVLAFDLDPDEREDAQKLLIEAGLVVAFTVDGECAPVTTAHAEMKKALVERRPVAKAVEALTEALFAHEAELRAFAGK